MRKLILMMTGAILFMNGVIVNATMVSNSVIVDDIEYYIQTDDSVYNLGEDVEMLFKVTNLGDVTLSIVTFYPIIDIIVSEKVGETYDEIWKWSWDKIYHTGPVLFKLEPDEFIELSGTWPQIDLNNSVDVVDHTQVPAGIYSVSGYLAPTDISVAVDITIVPEPCSILLLSLGGLILRKR